MAIYKKITSHGSINIPVALRRELGLEPRDPMELDVEGGKIVLSPYSLRCGFCGAADGVRPFMGRGICKGCLEKLREGMVVPDGNRGDE